MSPECAEITDCAKTGSPQNAIRTEARARVRFMEWSPTRIILSLPGVVKPPAVLPSRAKISESTISAGTAVHMKMLRDRAVDSIVSTHCPYEQNTRYPDLRDNGWPARQQSFRPLRETRSPASRPYC